MTGPVLVFNLMLEILHEDLNFKSEVGEEVQNSVLVKWIHQEVHLHTFRANFAPKIDF